MSIQPPKEQGAGFGHTPLFPASFLLLLFKMKTLKEFLDYDRMLNPFEYEVASKEARIMEQKAYDLGKMIDKAKLFHDYLDKTKGRNLLESLILMTHEKNIDVRDVTVLTTKYLLGSYKPNYKHNDLLSKLFYDNMKGDL